MGRILSRLRDRRRQRALARELEARTRRQLDAHAVAAARMAGDPDER